jgi:hypothetical protein
VQPGEGVEGVGEGMGEGVGEGERERGREGERERGREGEKGVKRSEKVKRVSKHAQG